MNLYLSFFIALVTSALLVPPLILAANRCRLVDEPNERKIHTQAVPRCGGIGIAISVGISIILLMPPDGTVMQLLIPGGLILLVGVLDDVFDLSYRWKLLGQSIVALFAINSGIVINNIDIFNIDSLPVFISYPLTAVFIIGVTNAVNLSDGLDGLAAGIILLSLGVISMLAYQTDNIEIVMMSLAMMGSTLGFLRYNTYPARIFLGDSGSHFLGFITACLVIIVTQTEEQIISYAIPLYLLGLPILDTITVIAIRYRLKQPLFAPDKNHIHYKLIERGFSHTEAVAFIYLLHALFLALAYFWRFESNLLLSGLYLTITTVTLGFFYWSGKTRWQLNNRANTVQSKERRNPWLRKISSYYDLARTFLQYAIIGLLVCSVWLPATISFQLSVTALGLLVILVCSIFLPDSYQKTATRFCLYVANIFACYLLKSTPLSQGVHQWMIDLYLSLMVISLLMAIRVTRKDTFRLNPLDLLIVLMVMPISGFLGDGNPPSQMGSFVVRLIALGYGIEFILASKSSAHQMLRNIALLTLLMIGLRG